MKYSDPNPVFNSKPPLGVKGQEIHARPIKDGPPFEGTLIGELEEYVAIMDAEKGPVLAGRADYKFFIHAQ